MHRYFPGILYPARLLTRHIISHHERARHRHDALIPLSETFGSQPFNSRVLSQSEHYGRAPRDIQYQRVKIYILILSHLGGFNKRVSVAQVFFYYEADGLERQTFWSLFLRQKIAGNSHNNRRGLKAVCVSVELEQKMIVRGHRGRVIDLYGLDRYSVLAVI